MGKSKRKSEDAEKTLIEDPPAQTKVTKKREQKQRFVEKENTEDEPRLGKKPKKGSGRTLTAVENGDDPIPTKAKSKKRTEQEPTPTVTEALNGEAEKRKKQKLSVTENEAESEKKGSSSWGARLTKKERKEEQRRIDRLARNQKKRAKKEARALRKSGQDSPKKPLPIPAKLRRRLMEAYESESKFISGVFAGLPKKQSEKLDGYLLEATPEEEEKNREAYFARTNTRSSSDAPQDSAPTREELKARLHAKIAELAQGKRREKKKRKVTEEDGTEKKGPKNKKQFISKPNPNFVKGSGSSATASIKAEPAEKTPLSKKPVKKSNGEVVYSKFDFISEDKHYSKQGKPKPTDLLKSAEKTENRIARLETSGKKQEAVMVAENQKWITALKRADGDKVRDDPRLLKKTINKQQKIKQRSQKKWTERTEMAEKQKEVKVNKRLSNIQARKEDKKKRVQKIQRKRGRIV